MVYLDAIPQLKDLAPYVEVWVELDGGQNFITMMTDVDIDIATGAIKPPNIGDRVELVVRKRRGWEDERGHLVYAMSARKPVKRLE